MRRHYEQIIDSTDSPFLAGHADHIHADTDTAAITINLSYSQGCRQRIHWIINTGSSGNDVTIGVMRAGDTINGATTYTLADGAIGFFYAGGSEWIAKSFVLITGSAMTGQLSATPDEITATSEGVAASIASINTEVTTNGDADLDNVTLANGTSGQIKHIYCVVEGNAADTWKITPATMCGGTQITFAGVGLGCTLVYADSEGWVVVANNGGTIS